MTSKRSIHSTYKVTLAVHQLDGEYRAVMIADSSPEGTTSKERDWVKPLKFLEGPICQTPEKAVSVFLRGLTFDM